MDSEGSQPTHDPLTTSPLAHPHQPFLDLHMTHTFWTHRILTYSPLPIPITLCQSQTPSSNLVQTPLYALRITSAFISSIHSRSVPFCVSFLMSLPTHRSPLSPLPFALCGIRGGSHSNVGVRCLICSFPISMADGLGRLVSQCCYSHQIGCECSPK